MRFLYLVFLTLLANTNSQENGISTDETLTQYYLWSKANPNQEQELLFGNTESVLASNFNANLPTKVLVHGFTDSGLTSWVIRVKNEFLQKGTKKKDTYLKIQNFIAHTQKLENCSEIAKLGNRINFVPSCAHKVWVIFF